MKRNSSISLATDSFSVKIKLLHYRINFSIVPSTIGFF